MYLWVEIKQQSKRDIFDFYFIIRLKKKDYLCCRVVVFGKIFMRFEWEIEIEIEKAILERENENGRKDRN